MNENLPPIIKKALEHPLLIILAFFQLLFIIMFIVALVRYTEKADNADQSPPDYFDVNITNLNSKVENINKEAEESLNSMLSNIINNNTDYSPTNINATIRDKYFFHKTFSTTDDQYTEYYNFIVDIPSLKQEYQVKLDLTSSGDAASPDDAFVVTCIEDKDHIAYKDFTCKNFTQYVDKYEIISQYATQADLGYINITSNLDNNRILYVDMTSTDETEEQAKKKVDAWIKSMGYSLNGFQYEFYDGDNLDSDGNI